MNVAAPNPAPSLNHKVALDMAGRGIPVFPCWEISVPGHKLKSPRNAGGHLRATPDPAQINIWWTQWPDALVGIDLPSARLMAIDADRHGGPDGVAAWEAIARLFGDVGPELVPYVRTPSGGFHVYFRRPDGMDLSNQTGGLPEGIDVRAAGYTIAPGCVMPDGRTYEPVGGSPALSLDIAYAPDWLIDLIGSSGPPSLHSAEPLVSLDGEVEIQLASALLEAHKGAVEGEGGDAATYALACRLRALGVSEARCCEFMTGDWNNRCSPPWHPDDLERIVGNAYRYGKGGPGAQSPRLDFADVKPLPPVEGVGVADRPGDNVLRLIDPGQWHGREVPKREWAIDGWMPARQTTLLTGSGGAGKSLLMQQACTCVAMGVSFLGIQTKHAVALYLTCEDDEDELHRRQRGICRSLGIELSALSGRLHLVSLVGSIGNELATFDSANRMTVTGAYGRVAAAITTTGADFVVLDNVAHLFAGNENIRVQVAAFVALLNGLASRGPAVSLIAHPNKAGQEYSGSTAWENQVRTRLVFGVPIATGSEVDPDVRCLSRGKANYSALGNKLKCRWEDWSFVVDDGLKAKDAAKLATIANTADDRVFLACLDERTKQRRAVSDKTSPSFAPTQFAKMPAAKAISKDRLAKAMERLFAIGRIERAELWMGDDRKMVFGLRRVAGGDDC